MTPTSPVRSLMDLNDSIGSTIRLQGTRWRIETGSPTGWGIVYAPFTHRMSWCRETQLPRLLVDSRDGGWVFLSTTSKPD